jgi:hypothetical protein
MVVHGRDVGAPTMADIDRRAQEIADIRGHDEKFTEEDLKQARRELFGEGEARTTDDAVESDLSITRDPSEPVSDRGEQFKEMNGPDENDEPARLARQGVDEAAHDQMLAAERARRNRDLE